MKTLNLIKVAAATLAAFASLSLAAPSNANTIAMPLPDLQPSSFYGNAPQWITQNGTPYRQIFVRNNGNVAAGASMANVIFSNGQQTVNKLVVVPPVPAKTTMGVLVPAPFTNLGPGIGLAIHLDVYNNMVKEYNEGNNSVFVIYQPTPPVVVVGNISVLP
jgi:hypothetical protein